MKSEKKWRPVKVAASFGIFLFTMLAASMLQAAPLTIVEGGRGRAVIVVEPDQPKAMRAGEALQTYIEKMSGARLGLVEEGTAMPDGFPVRLLVGHTAAAGGLGVTIPAGFDQTIRPDIFEEEGYVLKTVGQDIVVAGNNDGPYKGTVYAAYALLERLGCRWYFPGDWGEVIPERKTIAVADLDIRSRPDFAVRTINPSGWVPMSNDERTIYHDWGEKIGFNFAPFYPQVGDGFLAYLTPPNDYFASNPEFFAMNERGERHAGEHATLVYYENTTMLCLSNPEVFKESVKNLRAAFAGEKKMGNVSELGFGISPPDGTPYCYCKGCKAQSLNLKYLEYFDRTYQSEEFFGFAAGLAREFPDKIAATMAYSLREMVPEGIDIPDNLMVMYAPIACDVLHPNDTRLWRRRDHMRILRKWRKMTPHITIYDYNPGLLIGNWVPERDTANIAVNAAIYKKVGIKGFRTEGRKAFMQTWTSYYARAKLLWDTDTDIEVLKADLYNTFFGPAAGPHVQAWWDACEDALVRETMQVHEDFFINHIYNIDFVRGIQKHVEAARRAKATDVQGERVEAFALIAEHLLAFAMMNAAEMRLDYAAAATAAGRMVQLENRLHDIYSFFIENGPPQASKLFPTGRGKIFKSLAEKVDGTAGELVASLPLEMTFRRDLFNEGIVGDWHDPEFDDSDWGRKNTYYTWDQQDPPEDESGHDYNGIGWYRSRFTVDAKFADRPLKFWCGGAINEGWVWINGKFVGYKPYSLWWYHNHDFELDITEAIKFGQENTIAIRVLNSSEIGGLMRRGFFWSPNN